MQPKTYQSIHISTIVRRAARFRPDRFTLLLASIAALGAGIVLLRVYNGVGEVGDSKYYLRVASELIRRESWQVWLESSFRTEFPPGYPILLALASLFIFDPLDAAGPLNAAAFGLTIFISGHWLRQCVQSRLLVVLGCLAVLVSSPVVWVASFAWSEMPFILLTTLALFQGDNYLRSGKKRSSLIWAGVFTALAFLTRYAGVTILMALLPLFLLQRRMTVVEKARDIGLYVAISTAPTGLYMLRNFLLTGTLAGPRTASDYSILTNVQRTLDTIKGFNPLAMDYFPSVVRTPEAALVILVLLAGLVGYGIIRWMYGATNAHEDSFLPVVGSFAFVYLGFMVVTATILAFGFNHLDTRFLSPAYVPLTLAIVSAIGKIPKYWGELMRVSGLSGAPALQNISTGGVLARFSGQHSQRDFFCSS